jgi:hypothetical protein
MVRSRYFHAVAIAVCIGVIGAHAVAAEVASAPAVSRVEVVLASQYKNQVATVKEEFVQAGMPNVHFQFFRQGQHPKNIGL